MVSRREFLKTAGSGASFAALPLSATAVRQQLASPDQIAGLFEHLPGDKSIKILTRGRRGIDVQLNPDKRLFAASAIKTFALCEALRQIDSPEVVAKLKTTPLALDSTVWSFESPTFNPPNLAGTVFERATLEAMITSSDNTATDMIFKLAGPDNIRDFISSAGLTQTLVPDSTRAFSAYLVGVDNYKTITWEELLKIVNKDLVHPLLNDVQTLASSAGDFVSYYSRALRGKFFKNAETLNEFRRILTLCDFIYLVPLPLGGSAFAKSGNADLPGFHVRTIAGGMLFSNQWVFFAFIINWYSQDANDSKTVDQFFFAINLALTLVRNSLI